jgi:RND family efflux transporter MFP subunit
MNKTIPMFLPALLGAWLLGCKREHPAPAPAPAPAISVQLQPASAGTHQAVEDVVGTVRAKTRAAVEAKVSGRIVEMMATLGRTVKTGDLLVRLDAQDLEARLEQARALFAQTERDLERMRRLINEGAVTRQELDAVEARYLVTKAGVTEAETMLGYARVVAPFDGVITRKLADVGDLAAPGRALLEIEAPGELRLEADVSEALIDKVSVGQKLSVRVASLRDSLTGTVAEVAPAADPASRTFLVKLDLPPTPGLRAGQFGRVSVPASEGRVLTVPASAVVQRGQLDYVLVASEGRAQLRIVKTGKLRNNQFEILSGLDAGEKVVVSSAAEVRDGQPLEVRP